MPLYMSGASWIYVMNKEEAINHIIWSTRYWTRDTIDDSYYPNNLGLERAFEEAVYHVKNSH